MRCSDCQDLLSEYIDNELHDLKRTQVGMHLEKCNECTIIFEDLTQIVSVSRALPALAPRNELWGQIEAEIMELTAPTEVKGAAAGGSSRTWKRFWNYKLNFSLSMPQLAASVLGMIVLMIITATISYHPENVALRTQDAVFNSRSIIAQPIAHEMNPEEAELNGAINLHMQSIDKRRENWDPKMQELFDRNLGRVDRSITECKQLIDRNPNDQICHEILIIAYKEKLRLLEQFSSL